MSTEYALTFISRYIITNTTVKVMQIDVVFTSERGLSRNFLLPTWHGRDHLKVTQKCDFGRSKTL